MVRALSSCGTSMQLRLCYAIGRSTIEQAGFAGPILLSWGRAQLESALNNFPNDQWLHYYLSKLLLNEGKTDEARKCLMPVVKRQQRAAWVWLLLGHIYEADSPENAITCYFRAVQVATEPQEIANTRLNLAGILAKAGRYEEATLQVRQALDYRQANNYSVPQALMQMARSDWYRELGGRTDLPTEPDVSVLTDSILYGGDAGELKYSLAVVVNQNAEKALAYVAFNPDHGVVLPYRKFRGIDGLSVGRLVEVALDPDEHRPVRWRNSNQNSMPGFVDDFSGGISQRDGQTFGFLTTVTGDRIFIHPSLMCALDKARDAEVYCLAMMGKDKQGKPGWRALRWLEPPA